MNSKLKSFRFTLAGFVAILFWAFSVPVSRSIMEQAGLLTGASITMLLGGSLSLAFKAARGGVVKNLNSLSRKYYLVCGALFVFYMLAWYPAIGGAKNRSIVLEVGLLNYLWPACTLLFSIPLLGKRANWALIPGTIIAFAGAVMAVGHESLRDFSAIARHFLLSPLSYILGLACAVSWGLYSNFNRKFAEKAADGAVPVFMILTGIFLLLFRLFSPEQSHWSSALLVEIVFISIATTLGYELWDLAMRKGDHSLVAASAYLTPFFSTVLTGLLLKVAVPAEIWLSCVLIIVGAAVCKFAMRN